MSRVKINVDNELLKKYREYQIGELLSEEDDGDFECYILNRVFERNETTKLKVYEYIKEYDVIVIDASTATILTKYNRDYKSGYITDIDE